MESKDVKIVAIVGMCGSGKSTAIEYLTERGIPKVYFGGVILNAIKEAGEEITPENEKKFREGLREKEGKDFFGNPTTVKVPLDRVNPGYIQGVSVKTEVNKKLGTVIATPAQAAFLTVQGEWAVYYNRAGKIVGIELFDGQF